ncbi:MAG: glycosyltransferase family 2 protein, partial [Chryseobacterium sp.]
MRPIKIPKEISSYVFSTMSKQEMAAAATKAYQNLYKGSPEITIVMPAYNESETIVSTLFSLCSNITSYSVEILVVNNNSKDDTGDLIDACGVRSVFQPVQGIVHARNAGLAAATGKYILNADADTIYPEYWIEEMVKPLVDYKGVAITYGRFGFVPIGSTGRMTYFFYEYIADFSRWINKLSKDEAVNVYGFNSGFRRTEGLSVDGFTFPKGASEDGWLAVKLREKGFGTLYEVT